MKNAVCSGLISFILFLSIGAQAESSDVIHLSCKIDRQVELERLRMQVIVQLLESNKGKTAESDFLSAFALIVLAGKSLALESGEFDLTLDQKMKQAKYVYSQPSYGTNDPEGLSEKNAAALENQYDQFIDAAGKLPSMKTLLQHRDALKLTVDDVNRFAAEVKTLPAKMKLKRFASSISEGGADLDGQLLFASNPEDAKKMNELLGTKEKLIAAILSPTLGNIRVSASLKTIRIEDAEGVCRTVPAAK